MPGLIGPARGSGLDTRHSLGFLHALSQCSAADGATDTSKGVSNATNISGGEGNAPPWQQCFNSQVDKGGVSCISLGVFYTVK